eukprot:CAMPEP_0204875368 /NCGR_PEP_ID=MMETSP1348-20121228/45711_1 /ASSEMBLY_ACC=CAM_ASM_000700 /TAXON_ID=215587 /ORGANISM="Aplanochytrium stocchinoi, Strain GSBS06" /LENGTH=51 /DNA_ID=CAMNT_0052031747 /DNA_START=36 /DNA_END=188 /DNA_ORIENTATION=-
MEGFESEQDNLLDVISSEFYIEGENIHIDLEEQHTLSYNDTLFTTVEDRDE